MLIGYYGFERNTEVPTEIENPEIAHITGAGLVMCQECGGDGDWGKYLPVPEPSTCVVCNGTGKTYISM